MFALSARRGHREAQESQRKASAVIEALEKYNKDKQAYPSALTEMIPAYLGQIPRPDERGARDFYYRASRDQKKFWLGFDDHSGVFLPTDMIYEYDSETRRWEFMDISQGKSVNLSGEDGP